MRSILLAGVCWLTAQVAWAEGPPVYVDDPFGDRDFDKEQLILDPAHPTAGRGEVGVLFSTSIIDKYSGHVGGTLDFSYHFTESLGAALSVGIYHAQLTSIVTGDRGILANRVEKCAENGGDCNDGQTGDNTEITPPVPDYRQVTSVANAFFVWSPLYGKVNVVSELDVNLQLYALVGGGIIGTREIRATYSPTLDEKYVLDNTGFGAGGFFSGIKVNGAAGVGLRVFAGERLSIRAEMRGIGFSDEFDFDEEKGPVSYLSMRWFAQVGAGFVLF